MSMEIVLRTPCTFHKNCDETSVGLLHRSKADGEPRAGEVMCMVCEGVLRQAKEAFLKTGKWTCPICDTIHTLEKGKLVPALSYWYSALELRR